MNEGIHNGKASHEGWRGIGAGSELSSWGRNGRREWNSSRDMGMRSVYDGHGYNLSMALNTAQLIRHHHHHRPHNPLIPSETQPRKQDKAKEK
jgi:hypothetical protein